MEEHPERRSPHWWEAGGVQGVFNSLHGFGKGRPGSTAQFLPAVLVCNPAILLPQNTWEGWSRPTPPPSSMLQGAYFKPC